MLRRAVSPGFWGCKSHDGSIRGKGAVSTNKFDSCNVKVIGNVSELLRAFTAILSSRDLHLSYIVNFTFTFITIVKIRAYPQGQPR